MEVRLEDAGEGGGEGADERGVGGEGGGEVGSRLTTGLPSPGWALPSILSMASMMRPALEQSRSRMHGVLSQHCRSYTERGMYCVKERLKTQISPAE